MGLANSLALKIAGVSNSMQDPVGGTINRNADGGDFLPSLFVYVNDGFRAHLRS